MQDTFLHSKEKRWNRLQTTLQMPRDEWRKLVTIFQCREERIIIMMHPAISKSLLPDQFRPSTTSCSAMVKFWHPSEMGRQKSKISGRGTNINKKKNQSGTLVKKGETGLLIRTQAQIHSFPFWEEVEIRKPRVGRYLSSKRPIKLR